MGAVYNLTDGGEGSSGRIYSEETKLKMSLAQKGKKRKPFSEEHKRKIAEASRNISDEQREAIRESNRNRVWSDNSKEKLSKANKGRKPSDESRSKMSQVGKGRIFSEEHKRKIGIANSNRSKEALKISAQKRLKTIALKKQIGTNGD